MRPIPSYHETPFQATPLCLLCYCEVKGIVPFKNIHTAAGEGDRREQGPGTGPFLLPPGKLFKARPTRSSLNCFSANSYFL